MLKKKHHMLLLHHRVMQPISSSTNSFMAPILLLLFSELIVLSLLLHPTHAMISLGSSLSPTTKPTSWLSPSGLFAFGFYNQGNGFAVGIWLATSSSKTIVWTANRDDPPVPPSTKLLLTEGGLLLQTPGSPDKNISGHKSSSASSASLLDSGNFILYDSRSEIIWGTFDFPTDTILAGQQLLEGNQLVSSISGTDHSTGRFRIKLQGDGNFVSYPVGEYDNSDIAYWASGSNTVQTWENMSLYLNISGSISLINRSSNFISMNLLGEPVSSSSGTTVYRATLDPDGIFRRYSHEFKGNNVSIESTDVTPIRNMCVVKGICGINSYCTQMDASFVCLCLTGYEFKDLNQQFMGCLRNFSNENCMGKKDRMTYSMSPLKNMTWQDSSYETLPSNSEEDCNDKCLGDCLCGAAMFDGQNCNKLRIPQIGFEDVVDNRSACKKRSNDYNARPRQ